MQKVKLDLDADDIITFERTVQIPTPDGKPLKVTFDFKYRDREAMAELLDSYIEKSKAAVSAEGRTMVQMARDNIKSDVEAVKEVATGWNVEGFEFDDKGLAKFFKRYAGAALAIISDYRVSLTEGRLGN